MYGGVYSPASARLRASDVEGVAVLMPDHIPPEEAEDRERESLLSKHGEERDPWLMR